MTAPAHHRHRHRLRGFGYLRRLGPGIVTGAADDDPSGIGTYSQVGAAFGFGFLWTAVVCLPLAAAVQETAARLGLVSGKGLAALIRARWPRAVLFAAVLMTAAANLFNIGADLRAMAAAARLVVPLPFVPLVIGIAVVILALEVFVSYHSYAKVLRWLTLSLGAYLAALVVVGVDWGKVARSLVSPSVTIGRTSVAALIAIFGTTISPYLFFWQTSEEVEEEIEHPEMRVDGRQLRSMRIDVVAGMFSAVVVMAAIMIVTAETLGAHGITTITTADQAARALRPVAGSFAGIVFALGVLGTGALAVPVLAGATGYALSESFGWTEGLSKTVRQAPRFYAVVGASLAIALILGLGGVDPVRGLYYAAILNGIVAGPLILLISVLARSDAMGPYRSRWLSLTLTGVAFTVMVAAPIAYILL